MSISNVGSALYSDSLKVLDSTRKSDLSRKEGGAAKAGSSRNRGDQVTISSRGNDLGRLAELAKAAPEIRSERVAELKSALEDGSLNVDSRELAAKMFKEMSLESWF
ncbi:MAG: flagellar biosynthesis anti-sigma factor FlgM [Deltaproteobacteria bacterium]|nr:flagellar biosynthesis anti-sigma factor FlgM [Candidatus Tharpella sp.]